MINIQYTWSQNELFVLWMQFYIKIPFLKFVSTIRTKSSLLSLQRILWWLLILRANTEVLRIFRYLEKISLIDFITAKI